MMRAIVAALGLLLFQSVAAEPFSRVLWYKLTPISNFDTEKTLFRVEASEWWRLRVHEKNQGEPQLWSSQGDGLFVSHRPLDSQSTADYTDYFYQSASPGQNILMMRSGRAELYRSERETQTDFNDSAHIKLSDKEYQETVLRRETGFEAHNYHHVENGQVYTTRFAQPGLYHLEIRVPWQASYELRDVLTLRAKLSNLPSEKQIQIAMQPDTGARYYDTANELTQLLSRGIQVPFYITQDDQEISIAIDRSAYLRWLETDSESQFLFERNAPREIEQERHKQLAFEESAPVTTSFYRNMPPSHAMATKAFIPLTGSLRESRERVLPEPSYATAEPEYFYQVQEGKRVEFKLPLQSRHAPVRLSVELPEHHAAFLVSTDSGEQQQFEYYPELKIEKDWELDNDSQIALASTEPPHRAASRVVLAFERPYQTITVENGGAESAWLRLDYRNQNRMSPTDYAWLFNSGRAVNGLLLQALIDGDNEQLALMHSPLADEVSQLWRLRILTRAAQFSERYSSDYVTRRDHLGTNEYRQLQESLAESFDVEFETLSDIYNHMLTLNYNFSARQLVVDLAVGLDSLVQDEAETLLLREFISQDRWFDVEGYWAWRMLYRPGDQAEALREIAQSWIDQNRQREAAQLLWLLEQNGALPNTLTMQQVALRAAQQSQQNSLAQHWLKQLSTVANQEPPLPDHAVQAELLFSGITREALIYNVGLDQYLTTLYLENSSPIHSTVQNTQQIRLTLYPMLAGEPNPDALLEKAIVKINQESHTLAIRMDRASEGLVWSQDESMKVGEPQSFTFTLNNYASNDIAIEVHGFEAAIAIERLSTSQHSDSAKQIPELTLKLMALVLEHQGSPLSDVRLKQINAETINKALTFEQVYLLDKLIADYGWQRLDTIQASSGISFQESDRWRPASPGLRLIQALMLEPVREGERRLDNEDSTQIEVELEQVVRLKLQLRKANSFNAISSPATVEVTTSTGLQRLVLGDNVQEVNLDLERGQHVLSLKLDAPTEALVFYRLVNDNGEPVISQTSVKTYRASLQQAVEIFVPGNSLLRIDTYQQGVVHVLNEYKWFSEDTLYSVQSTGDAEYSDYRFFIWEHQPLNEDERNISEQVVEMQVDVRTAPAIWPINTERNVFSDTIYSLNEQGEGTWGFDLGYRVRNNFDEDIDSEQEEFLQVGWDYRRRIEDWNSYWNSSVQWRSHKDTGLDTIVGDSQFYWLTNKYFDVEANLNGYYQVGAQDEVVEGAWSVYGSLSGRWKYFWNERSRNELELSIFGRELSQTQVPIASIDDDIVTGYKLDHRYGITLSDEFYYQPWLDSRVHLGAAITLNEFDQKKFIDRWRLRTGWRQYWKPWRFGADVSYTRYLGDENRTVGLATTLISFSADYDLWKARGSLWQIGVDLRHDIDRDHTGFFLTLAWNRTEGQGYGDFAPQNLIFSPLRKLHALEKIETNDIATNSFLGTADDK